MRTNCWYLSLPSVSRLGHCSLSLALAPARRDPISVQQQTSDTGFFPAKDVAKGFDKHVIKVIVREIHCIVVSFTAVSRKIRISSS